MCFFRFFSLSGFCQYISREIFLGLLEIVANLILEQGDGTTNLFKSWIPANLSDILITHWNCYPFFVCNKETISNFNMCWFSIFGACFEFVVGVWCGLGDRSYSIFDGFLWRRRWWPGFHTQSKTSSPGSTFQGGLARKFNLLGLSGLHRLST